MTDTRNNPHFVLFPTNVNRTGYQPFALPVLYIEPRRLDENGNGIEGSQAISVRYYVVDAPDPARVNGPFNQNIRIPDESLFEVILNQDDLADKQLDIRGFTFFGSNGSVKKYSDAVEGDEFEYNMVGPIRGSTPTSRVVYYPDAYYYDLSDVFIDVDQLIRPKRYFFVWESVFFRRVATASGDLKCFTGDQSLSQLIFDVNHPGDVHEQMFRMTPMLYFDLERNTVKDDPTLKFYRPFADLLQDIFDEQNFLDGVNQIDTIPAEYIPYLAFLIGVDLPNFPGTTDSLRRSILKRGSELQKLKSSRRVLIELFDMFGFIVDIVNLYASLDGNSYLSPNNGIDAKLVTQTDLVLNNYDASGFGVGDVPLVYRPRRNSQIALHAWIVKNGSEKHDELIKVSNRLSSDLDSENIDGLSFNINGILEPQFVNDIGTSVGDGIIGYSTVIVGEADGSVGRPVINSNNISYSEFSNLLTLYFDHDLSVDQDAKVFVFISYERTKLTIPSVVSNTRTNKFDVEFISKQGVVIDFNLLQFLLDFVFNLKGFHSILRKIKVPIENIDVYGVTDTCVDGNDPFAPGTVLGDLQSSPAIIPIDLSCQDSNDRGYSESDLILRRLILDGLEEEFQAWKALSPDDCALTSDGQDKVIDGGLVDSPTDIDSPDYDHEIDDRETICGDNPLKLDYCYKGRVEDTLRQILTLPSVDRYSCNLCGPSLGNVVYWEEKSNKANLDGQIVGLLKNRISNRLGDSSLHYSSSPFFDKLPNSTLAITPINIDIKLDNLGFPSHKFLGMNNLNNDYNVTNESIGCFEREEVLKRPWDEVDECGFPNLLNAKLIDNGEYQDLVWDEEELIYFGNGVDSDIPSLDDHSISISDGRTITHKIYQNSSDSHPSLTFDSSTFTDIDSIDTSAAVTGPIFDSSCSIDGSDFIGGYPSSHGLIDTDRNTFIDSINDEDEFLFGDTVGISVLDRVKIANSLCIGYNTGTANQARFFGNSMEYIDSNDVLYRHHLPLRMDCGCLNNSCGTDDPTGFDGVSCSDNYLYDNKGNFDPNCDKLEFDLAVSLSDTMTLCDRLSDFELDNLFCLNKECVIPDNGSFIYKDSYDIIYEVEWVFMEDTIDITVVTKDPRIPNKDEDGFVINEKGSIVIFRKGVITTVRQIIKIENGSVYIDAEGSDVVVDYFQTNISCSGKQFDKPFAYGVDCALQANVELMVTDGPHWVSHDGFDSSFEYYWVDPLDESDVVFWVDPMDTIKDIDVDSISTDGQSSSSSSSS